MKRYLLIICVVTLYIPFAIGQVEICKKKSEMQWLSDTICYYNGNPYTGEIVDYSGLKFDKTKLLYDGHFKDGLRNGILKIWYPNFKIELMENYKVGIKDGVQTYFNNNGTKKSEIKYTMGNVNDGIYINYLANGQKETETTYKNGKIVLVGRYEDGKYIVTQEQSIELYPNGLKKFEGTLISGKKEGIWNSWYEEGQPKCEEMFKDGIHIGPYVSWFEYGKKELEGNYLNGKKEGLWISWYERGQKKSEENYKDGLKNGLTVSWFVNGQKESEGSYRNDKKEGRWDSWFSNGQKEFEGSYLNDLMDGYGIYYYNFNGDECYKGQWRLGTRNGKGEYFRHNSNGFYVSYSGEFYDDKFSGQGTEKNYSNSGSTLDYEFTGQWLDGIEYNGKAIIYRNVNGVNTAEDHYYVNGKESFWKGVMEDLQKDIQKH
jgi:uncharacterized protein